MILITGGGTGGHLAVAKAVSEELKDEKLIYIGSNYGQDKLWFKNSKIFQKTFFFKTRSVVNKGFFGKVKSLFQIFKATIKCLKIIKKYKISKVFSVGGYAAAPATFAAILTKIPIFIHEQNAITGKLNQILKPFSKAFFNSFDINSPIKDYPIREEFFLNSRIRKELKTIIFLGGSQGASFINNLARQLTKELNNKNIKIIHQCGNKDFEDLKQFYKKENLNVDLFEFSEHIIEKIKLADFAISRAGAGSVWELTANCLPSLFIPYPYAAKNHQFFNANFLSSKNLAFLVEQKNVEKNKILNIIFSANLEQISKQLSSQIQKDGAKKIANFIISYDNT